VSAPPATSGFQAFLSTVRVQALAQGIRPATIDAILPSLSFNQRVVDLDRSQPDDSSTGTPPSMSDYLTRRLDPVRISRGRDRYTRLQPQLMAFESRFGVPGSILLGIWGMETNYGSYTGDFDIFRSLASLAYDGRRRALFTNELIAALQIVDRGLAPRSAMLGSWAGAMGNPQFLPSSFLKSAVDGDGDGRADIWTSEADALASIANYLAKAGWKRGEPWGLEVRVPPGLDRSRFTNTQSFSTCPRVHARHSRWMTVAEWKAAGLIPDGTWPSDALRATLIEADGPNGRAFLAFDNYRALLEYNCSNYYAISVGLLADAVSR
jgi:lytic murein transglycosylase